MNANALSMPWPAGYAVASGYGGPPGAMSGPESGGSGVFAEVVA